MAGANRPAGPDTDARRPQHRRHSVSHAQHSLAYAHGASAQNKQSAFPQLSRKFVARRISEGETGRLKEELKCQACGKGYKHVSSLAKHLWEHTPEWNVTSKLLISKHQQVQLLEAASILVSMNDEDDEEDEAEGLGESSRNTSDEPSVPPTPEDEDTYRGKDQMEVEDGLEAAKPDLSHGPKKNVPAPVEPVKDASDPVKDSAADLNELTPAVNIPILSASARPIAKTPSRHSHRRLSTNTGSLGSLNRDSILLRQASPLPESVLAKDHSHHPPYRRRRQSNLLASSVSRDTNIDLEEDGLQDPQESTENDTPHTPRQSPKDTFSKKSVSNEDVFGLEV